MRPRLLPDTHLLPSAQGVVIRGPRHTAAFPMPGIYPWLERIRPFLDGAGRLDELVADLAPQAAQQVRALVELLLREGFVRDAEGDLPHRLSPGVRARHCALIDFIALRADSPEHRFELYRNCAPVVVGSGQMASSVVLSLLASGVEYVRLSVEEAGGRTENRLDTARLDECVELLRRDGGSFRYEALPGGLGRLPVDAGVVVLASDEFDRELTTRVRVLAAQAGLVHGQAVASGRYAYINAACSSDAAALAGPGGGDGPGGDGIQDQGPCLGGPVAALAANQLCLQLLCQVARLDERESGGGTPAPGGAVLDLATARFLTARPARPA
jgi:hypothetical protein